MTSIKDIPCSHGKRMYQLCLECSKSNPDFMSKDALYIGQKVSGPATAPDMVNHPPHYKVGGIETIDYIQAKLTDEEFSGYCKGNALKYISRANHKKDATEDLRKAIWYLNRLVTPEGN